MKNLLAGMFSFVILFISHLSYGQVAGKAEFKREFLEDINHIRAKGCNCGVTYFPPAPPLTWNNNLEIAATGHAYDMAARKYFSHTSKDGRTAEDRIALAGYTFKGYRSFAVGENIAEGQMSIAEVMQGWIKSEGHCHNLMNPAYREVGIAWDSDYWVQDFGGRVPFSAEEQKMIRSGRYRLIEKN